MKVFALLTAAVVAAFSIVACAEQPLPRAYVPGPEEQAGYHPQALYKPMPQNGEVPTGYPPGYQPQMQPGMQQQPAMGGQPGQPGMMAPVQALPNEQAFVQAYVAHRSPKVMVFVNRTIQGDPLPKDGLNEVIRVEDRQAASGAVNVNSNRSSNGNAQSTSSGFNGASASNSNTNRNDTNSFIASGPVEYTHTTSVKSPADKYDVFGASAEDYQMIEASLVRYFDNSGKVMIQDSDAARAKLNREQILRIENGDAAAARLLATELQQDILIRVTAVPTKQATSGQPSVRLIAKAVSTTDGRMLGSTSVDMPMPMGKTNINNYTGYIASELMGDMARKWMQPAAASPIEVRIYKTAAVDDALKISDWLKKTDGVTDVRVINAAGGSTTSYATIAVGYDRSPAELYANLKESIGLSQGLKAVDLSSNTINLELTGQVLQLTTTRRSETRTVTETHTTEERRVEPINPAPAPVPPQ